MNRDVPRALPGLGLIMAIAAAVAYPPPARKLREPARPPVADLKRQLGAGADVLLVDVRPAADFTGEQGHIAGARNLPLEELPARLAELEDRKTRAIRLLCRTDRRSAEAARLLAEAGYTDARVIRGGMTAWRANGWPAENAKV